MKNEQVVQLPLNRLTEFPEHPFKVRDDEYMPVRFWTWRRYPPL